MRAIVVNDKTEYQLDTLELAMLHAAAREANKGAKVTKATLQKVLKSALENYCREVAATAKKRKQKGGKA